MEQQHRTGNTRIGIFWSILEYGVLYLGLLQRKGLALNGLGQTALPDDKLILEECYVF
jgi:hypothetical protein